ncbi:nucleotide sugar dehydrogenase [Streptacidiphilus rugosus]|uniref:nucleotide sugar dehydrogenase n=1 Tax=Streptacidiphilus rugosus TaxID=405783 RepID=UPI00068B881C|nr:nucleotide sugar dehydrogenase [Streptacidiphilus rugosus]
MRVVVVGQGYVGLPLAVRAAEVGHEVVGYDVDTGRIKRLADGESYVEDVASERLRAVLASGAYRASDAARDCGGFDVAVVTVPTPLHEGVPDLTYIEESARTLSRYLRPGATVVLESTTYPGTTQDLFGPLLEDGSGLTAGTDFHLGYSPERIDPGNAVWGFQQTPKVVSGVDAASLEAVRSFYGQLVDTVVPVASPKEAELAKLLENTFRHVNIALVNEIAMFARHLDIDVWQAIDAAATKPFGFMRFTPGPGVGGHCLPIDPSYLSWRVQRELGQSFRFVELANDINNHMPEYVTRRLIEAFNERRRSVNGSRVLLLGLAYKKNTGDARESPALRVAHLLLDLGAEVHAADPHVVEPPEADARLARVELTAEELAAADAVVILTDHDSFDYGLVREHARYVLDCRRRLAADDASAGREGSLVEVL